MATIFSITITIGKGENARERTISIDPEDVPMGILEDLEAVSISSDKPDWKTLRSIMKDLFGLTNEEFRAVTVKQFIQIATALMGAVSSAVAIPNGATPPPPSA